MLNFQGFILHYCIRGFRAGAKTLAFVIVFAWIFGLSAVHAEDTVRFGAALSLTGKLAPHGKNVKDGYDFIVKHINERGGIPIGDKKYKAEIVYYDDESDAKTAVKLVEKLIVEISALIESRRFERMN